MAAVDDPLTLERLAGFLAGDYPKLRLYIGETGFAALTRHCLAALAHEPQKVRMLSHNLPDFLALTKPFSRSPELSDLARLEKAFHAACAAPDAAIIRQTQEPVIHGVYMIVPHPSLQRIQLPTNAASIWSALTAGELPPPPQRLDEPQELLIWRQGPNVRFRLLGSEEAMDIDAMSRDGKFEITQSVDGFLHGWIEAGIISALRHEIDSSR